MRMCSWQGFESELVSIDIGIAIFKYHIWNQNDDYLKTEVSLLLNNILGRNVPNWPDPIS